MMYKVQLDKLESDIRRITKERVNALLDTLQDPLAELYRELYRRNYYDVIEWKSANPETAQTLADFMNGLDYQVSSEVRAELMKEYGFIE